MSLQASSLALVRLISDLKEILKEFTAELLTAYAVKYIHTGRIVGISRENKAERHPRV